MNFFLGDVMEFSFDEVSYKRIRDREIGGFWVFN